MITRTKLPKFKGKPLIEIPKEIPTIGFLEGDFGKEFLKEYKGRVNSDYGNANPLNILSYQDGLVKGSNSFAVVLANQILAQEGLRVARQSDLERAMKLSALQLRGQYVDSGLVLRNEDEPNSYLAKDLYAQIKSRNSKKESPIMIPLTELDLIIDGSSSHGLKFKLKEDAEIIYAPILNGPDGTFVSECVDERTGLPSKFASALISQNRTLYTRSSGLSRLCLGGVLGLCSGGGGLASSVDDGRVVVVSAEGANAKLK